MIRQLKYKYCKLLISVCLIFLSFSGFSQSGYLYGTTYAGGQYGYGTLFRYNITTGKDTVLISFNGTNGAYPLSSVIQASNGLIFGNAYAGGLYGFGIIFSYNPLTGKDSIWKNFDSVNDGCYPIGAMMQSKSGLIYGTTVNGPKKFGALFSLNITTGQYKMEYAFDSTHGSFPWDAPLELPSGLLYGTTNSGGSYNDGVIFCFNPATGKDSTCLNFDDSVHGENPDCSLCLANDTLLYGMTNSGGALGYGVLFGYDPKNGQCKHLVSFNDTDGAYAYSNVIQASDGLLYGMTEGGGISEAGVILSYKPGDVADKVCSGLLSSTGANSFGSVIQAPSGLLYGTTAYGGSRDSGVIFSYDPVTNVYSKLLDFSNYSGTGYYPNASLLYVSDTVTGILEVKNNVGVKVYPNPGNGLFNFEFSGINDNPNSYQEEVEVYNILGEKIYSNQFLICNSKFLINISSQPSGIYLYRILTENGNVMASGKLTIQ